MTWGDKIRAMTNEELAELWWEIVDCGECVPGCGGCNMTEKDCKYWALAWLREEASDV